MRFVAICLACLILAAGCDVTAGAAAPATQPATHPSQMEDPSKITEDQWKSILTPTEYHVLREKGTERPFVGKYTGFFQSGTYVCAACGQELFKSKTKFHSECGWPAFYAAAAGDRVRLTRDSSLGMVRTEVTCARCGSHLGHVFDDAPDQPTGQRYCINSVSIKFIPDTPATQSTR